MHTNIINCSLYFPTEPMFSYPITLTMTTLVFVLWVHWGWRAWIHIDRELFCGQQEQAQLLPFSCHSRSSSCSGAWFLWLSPGPPGPKTFAQAVSSALTSLAIALGLASFPISSKSCVLSITCAQSPAPLPWSSHQSWSCWITCVMIRLPSASPFDCQPHPGKDYVWCTTVCPEPSTMTGTEAAQ